MDGVAFFVGSQKGNSRSESFMKIKCSLLRITVRDFLKKRNNRKLLVQLNEAYENPLTDEERTALQLIRNSHKRMIEKEPW